MTNSKKIEEQISTIKQATLMATQSKESATLFLKEAGIIRNTSGEYKGNQLKSSSKTVLVRKK
jgi:hypothetical protein